MASCSDNEGGCASRLNLYRIKVAELFDHRHVILPYGGVIQISAELTAAALAKGEDRCGLRLLDHALVDRRPTECHDASPRRGRGRHPRQRGCEGVRDAQGPVRRGCE